jgi:hypothetical protein
VWEREQVVGCDGECPGGCQGAGDDGYLAILPEAGDGLLAGREFGVEDLMEDGVVGDFFVAVVGGSLDFGDLGFDVLQSVRMC